MIQEMAEFELFKIKACSVICLQGNVYRSPQGNYSKERTKYHNNYLFPPDELSPSVCVCVSRTHTRVTSSRVTKIHFFIYE